MEEMYSAEEYRTAIEKEDKERMNAMDDLQAAVQGLQRVSSAVAQNLEAPHTVSASHPPLHHFLFRLLSLHRICRF